MEFQSLRKPAVARDRQRIATLARGIAALKQTPRSSSPPSVGEHPHARQRLQDPKLGQKRRALAQRRQRFKKMTAEAFDSAVTCNRDGVQGNIGRAGTAALRRRAGRILSEALRS